MVLASSDRISPVPPYSISSYKTFKYGTFTLFGHASQSCSFQFYTSSTARPVSLATTPGIIVILLSCRYLDVSVPCVRLSHIFYVTGCPIRTSTDQYSFAAPRSFSQLTTSFVASRSLGIRHTPLFASYSFNFRLLLSKKRSFL